MRPLLLVCSGIALLAAAGADAMPSGPPPAQPAAPAMIMDPAEWLAQHACLDAEGRPVPGLVPVVHSACTRVAPARHGALTYRSFDWWRGVLGVKASDSLLEDDRRVAITFDFGHDPFRFGQFDAGQDGGDEIRWNAGRVWISQTEDGGGGRQWFRDSRCPAGEGWLLWQGEPSREWRSHDYRLGIARDGAACPRGFSGVHTRWRIQEVTLPWHDGSRGGEARLEAVLTFHFSPGPPGTTQDGEFFVHARHLGRVMWGAFVHPTRAAHAPDRLRDREVAIIHDQRCAGAESQIQALLPDGLIIYDCRLYTQFRPGPAPSMEWTR